MALFCAPIYYGPRGILSRLLIFAGYLRLHHHVLMRGIPPGIVGLNWTTLYLCILMLCWLKHCKVANSSLVRNLYLCFSVQVSLLIIYFDSRILLCVLNWMGLSVVVRDVTSSLPMLCLMNGRRKPEL